MKRGRFLKIVLAVIACVFVFHQAYSALYNPLTTESAVYVEQTDGINATGIVIRNEKVIEGQSDGVVHFCVGDGERVAKGGDIADVYVSESDSVAVNRIAVLNRKIENIEMIQNYNDLAAIDINLLNNKIDSGFAQLLYSAGNGDYVSVSGQKENLLTMLNRKEMVVGNAEDFSAQLNELKTERDGLSAALHDPVRRIYADSSGFFVSSPDGLESALTVDDLSQYTPDFFEKLVVPETTDSAVLGKLVSDYTWYIAVTVTVDQSVNYQVGDTVRLHTALKSNPDLTVKVERINRAAMDGKAVMVFSCQEMNSTLAGVRTVPLTVVQGEYKGLKVDRGAVRVSDDKTGVYVVSGMELKFVSVNVLFMDDDYVICEKSASADSSVLRLYDKIVIKGKNLYDGKIIN